jgi:SAM-dependent methyltransferase
MTRAMTSILLVALLVILAAAGPVGAQTTAPTQHQHMGDHHTGGSSDRDIHHSFGQAKMWAREFDDPSRNVWQKPEEVLDALHLKRTARVADIGAGTGYFSVRLAKRAPDGKVFAVDIEPDMLRYVAERTHREHLRVRFSPSRRPLPPSRGNPSSRLRLGPVSRLAEHLTGPFGIDY